MPRRSSPLLAAGVAVSVALVVAAAWCGRSRSPVVETAVQATVAIRVSRHDAFGIPSPPVAVREPGRVRTIVSALGVEALVEVACPPDYASADVGLLLSGRDVYARRNVYVWDLFSDAGTPSVLVVSSSGCRGGPPADARALRDSLALAVPGLR